MKLHPSVPALAAGFALACAGSAPAEAADTVVVTSWGHDCSYTAVIREADGDRTFVHAEAYPWCRRAAASYYAYRYGYSYAYPWYVPPAGAVVGPYGAAVWGPYGGVAATTGTRYYRDDDIWGATRAGAAYNPWTGNAAAAQTKAIYDANSGTYAVGQRGGVANAYTGNEAQVGRGAVYNPNTGEVGTAAGVHTDNGSVVRVNDDVYVGRDGNVQQVEPGQRSTQTVRQPENVRTKETARRPETLRRPEGAARPGSLRRPEGARSKPARRR